jgi:hypothetical protein
MVIGHVQVHSAGVMGRCGGVLAATNQRALQRQPVTFRVMGIVPVIVRDREAVTCSATIPTMSRCRRSGGAYGLPSQWQSQLHGSVGQSLLEQSA